MEKRRIYTNADFCDRMQRHRPHPNKNLPETPSALRVIELEKKLKQAAIAYRSGQKTAKKFAAAAFSESLERWS